jgi:hypothetical protein
LTKKLKKVHVNYFAFVRTRKFHRGFGHWMLYDHRNQGSDTRNYANPVRTWDEPICPKQHGMLDCSRAPPYPVHEQGWQDGSKADQRP